MSIEKQKAGLQSGEKNIFLLSQIMYVSWIFDELVTR